MTACDTLDAANATAPGERFLRKTCVRWFLRQRPGQSPAADATCGRLEHTRIAAAVDGQFLCLGEHGHLLWMDLTPKGYREVSRARLFAARESWALPVVSRGLVDVVQNTRDFVTGASPRLRCYDLRE